MEGYEIVLEFKSGMTDEQHDRAIAVIEAHHCYVGGGGNAQHVTWVLNADRIVDIVSVTAQLLMISAAGLLPYLEIS